MELLKKKIHMNRLKCRGVSQLSLEEDFNVPDSKPDVGTIVESSGEVRMDDVKVGTGQVTVRGVLSIQVLYIAERKERLVSHMETAVPFEETIRLEGAESKDNVRLKWNVEDLNVSVINSRKLSGKAVLTLSACVEENREVMAATGIPSAEKISMKMKQVRLLQMRSQKKDILRVKKEITLPSNKPNIQEILWNDVQIRGVQVRLLDGKIEARGEIQIFFLYEPEGENSTEQWIEVTQPFQEQLDCSECLQSLLPDVEVTLGKYGLEIRADSDGEDRTVQADIVLDLDIKLYEEENVQILEDVHTPGRQLLPVIQEEMCESLLMKNIASCKAVSNVKMESSQPRILQICHSRGDVKIDEIMVTQEGLKVEGVVAVSILYITADDAKPFAVLHGVVPFQQKIEAEGMDGSCKYSLHGDLEQLSVSMLDSEEIEMKANVSLSAFVVREDPIACIQEIEEKELDWKRIQELPSMTGYVVQPGDTLWEIAKKYDTTIENIQEMSGLETEEIKAGECLFIVKMVDAAV
ncbi:MAG: DUF3794 domain-containing protein [Lachnospiraceae bacterium]|nr:DUF3794 domain-containing protein [Lachnospiraceae bacterium]